MSESRAQRPPEPPACRYCAFISYRHGGRDAEVAQWLGKAIEKYRLPSAVMRQYGLPARVGRVFRDEEELPTSSSLSEQIEQALRASRFILIICSPRLLQSKWCRREIELFVKLRSREGILAVLVDGDPSQVGGPQDPFPPEVRYAGPAAAGAKAIESEPIAADFRRTTGMFDRGERQRALLRIIAGLVGCNYDELYERDKRRARRRNSVLGVFAVALLCILATLGALAVKAHRETAAALRAAEESRLAAIAAHRQEAAALHSAEESKGAVVEAKKDTRQQTEMRRWTAYVAEITRLDGLWTSNRLGDVRRVLDEQIPGPGNTAPDLRGVEWYAWDRRLRGDSGFDLKLPAVQMADQVRCVALSPEDRFLAASCAADQNSHPKPLDSFVIVWDLGTRQIARTLSFPGSYDQNGRPTFDSNVTFSPDGKLLAACSRVGTYSMHNLSGSLRVWDVQTGAERFAISNDVRVGGRSIIFSPDSKSIIAGGYDGGWLAWSLGGGAANPPVESHPRAQLFSGATAISFSKKVADGSPVVDLRFTTQGDKAYLISASPGFVPASCAWPEADGKSLRIAPFHNNNGGSGTAYLLHFADSMHYLNLESRMGGGEAVINLTFSAASGRASSTVREIAKGVRCLYPDPHDGNELLVGCNDNIVRRYLLPNNEGDLPAAPQEYRGSWASAVTMDRQWVVGGNIQGIHLWPPNGSSKHLSLGVLAKKGPGVHFSQSEHFTASWDHDTRILSVLRTGETKPIVSSPTNHSAPLGVSFSPHERFVGISCGNMSVIRNKAQSNPGEVANGVVYDLQTGRQVLSFTSKTHWVHAFSFSEDESLCVAGLSKEGARVYHTDTGKLDVELTGMDSVLTKISKSGRFVAAGDTHRFGVYDRTRAAWLFQDQSGVNECVFDPTEKRVFLGGAGATLLRELPTGDKLPVVFESQVRNHFSFSPDGRRAFAMAGVGKLNVYDALTGTLMAQIDCDETVPTNPNGLESRLLEQLKGQ